MPTVTCKCKEVYHASDDHIGKRIKCRKCGRMVKIVADRKKRPKKEPRPKAPKAAGASARSAPPPGNRGEPYREERQHLDPKTRQRLMIAGAVFAGMSLLLGIQVYRSLHALPTQPAAAPADDNGMIAPPTPPLPTGLAATGLSIRLATT